MLLYIQSNAAMAFILAAIAGAVLHWAKLALRKEASWNLVAYWLQDYPGSSAGFAGALAVSIWAVVGSGSLEGMQAQMLIISGLTLGWSMDSGLNKGKRVVLPSNGKEAS